MEEQNGFIYIKDILEKLEYFEQNREDYRTFNDFYPEIITGLQNKLKNKCKEVNLPLDRETKELLFDMVEYLKVSQDDEIDVIIVCLETK